MAILRCTAKLLSELKLQSKDVLQTSDDLNSWHANLFRIVRRKCVIFTHDKTLYSFLALGLTKPDFQNFKEVFRQGLFKSLIANEIPQKQLELFLSINHDIEFGKTTSRSVLGSMNDLIFQLKYRISADGGILNTDINKANQYINHIVMGAIGGIYSIDELVKYLESLGGQLKDI